jgi:hypothetical protein
MGSRQMNHIDHGMPGDRRGVSHEDVLVVLRHTRAFRVFGNAVDWSPSKACGVNDVHSPVQPAEAVPSVEPSSSKERRGRDSRGLVARLFVLVPDHRIPIGFIVGNSTVVREPRPIATTLMNRS